MSRLLILAMGPLYEEGVKKFGGQCLRAWTFVEPLRADGHEICLVTLPIYDQDSAAMHEAALERKEHDGLQYLAFSNCDFHFILDKLRKEMAAFQPQALFGINITPAWVAAQLPGKLPLWADLFGYEMAEKQGRAARTQDSQALIRSWKLESMVARRADKLSTVSRPQLHALLGEMAGIGRMNQHTFHYHFAHHIPVAYHPDFKAMDATKRPEKNLLRGERIPQDAFILLWSGTYNFWTDPDFLFDVLEKAMEKEEKLHYVSTGGSVDGYNQETYQRFQERIAESPLKDRFHLLGWMDARDLPVVYQEADLGLSVDEANYETLFGARNRINNMMAAGLPVLSSFGSEISRMLEVSEGGYVCPPGNVDTMVETLLTAIAERDLLLEKGQKARQYALEEFAPHRLTQAPREWAQEPRSAPDNLAKMERYPDREYLLDCPLNDLDFTAQIREGINLKEAVEVRDKLKRLRGKSWYRAMQGVRRGTQTLQGKNKSQ